MQEKLLYALITMKQGMKKFFSDERGDVNVVAIVVLIAVAVVLAILLKDQITNLINTIMGKTQKKAEEILDGCAFAILRI